jgi:hypothetical protein
MKLKRSRRVGFNSVQAKVVPEGERRLVDILTGQSPVHALLWREGRSPECHGCGGRYGGHQEFTS